MNLNERMEFDHVIEILDDGSVIDRNDLHAPEFHESEIYDTDWSIYGEYHDSEFIGGGLERTLLERPGVYVCVVNYWDNDDDEFKEVEPTILEGWAILEYNG